MTVTAKVFKSGRSQALRLPAKLRLQVQEVRIEQIGNDLWVHPQTTVGNDMGRWLQEFYASSEPLPDDFLANRHDVPAQERDWT
jgi:antitoxin VapB